MHQQRLKINYLVAIYFALSVPPYNICCSYVLESLLNGEVQTS